MLTLDPVRVLRGARVPLRESALQPQGSKARGAQIFLNVGFDEYAAQVEVPNTRQDPWTVAAPENVHVLARFSSRSSPAVVRHAQSIKKTPTFCNRVNSLTVTRSLPHN